MAKQKRIITVELTRIEATSVLLALDVPEVSDGLHRLSVIAAKRAGAKITKALRNETAALSVAWRAT